MICFPEGRGFTCKLRAVVFRQQSNMYQPRSRLFTPERSLPRRLLAAVAITTVLFSFSYADGKHTDGDHSNSRTLSDVGEQRTEVVARATKSQTNDGRHNWFVRSKQEPIISYPRAPAAYNMHKMKRSSEYAAGRVSPGMRKSAGPCELGWTFKGNSCYKLTSELLTWSLAEAECRSMRSLLAEIENSREQRALHDFLISEGSEWVWIGLSKNKNDGSWMWSSGRRMSYSNWLTSQGEPNNLGGDENCVNVNPKSNTTWNDEQCTVNMSGVCQKAYCTEGWTSTRKSCYRLTDEAPRNSARDICRSMGGSLAEIKNIYEQSELRDFLKPLGRNFPWIGLSDPHKNRSWQWESGSKLAYSSWVAGEPNNDGGSEYCVTAWSTNNFDWNDEPCNISNPGVCKQHKSCAGESPLCIKLKERGFCTQGLHRHYMAIACRRSCGRCP